MRSKPKNVVVMADQHSGHINGLTHPDYQASSTVGDLGKARKAREQLWKYFADTIDAIKPIDVLLVNGDCIDGRGERSGGTELLLPDRLHQVENAARAIEYCKAKTVVMTRGCLTPGQRVLTADLRWVPVETLGIGDKIMGIDAEPCNGRTHRCFGVTTVTKNESVRRPVYRMSLSDGTHVEASEEHPFLLTRGSKYTWWTVGQLHEGLHYHGKHYTSKNKIKRAQRNLRDGIWFPRTFPTQKFNPNLLGVLKNRAPKDLYIVDSTFLGEREVCGLGTGTGTYVSDGFLSHNTPYHTGQAEDFEQIIADRVGAAKIGDHEWVDVNGAIFDLKHYISGSQVPHGRHTAIAREHLWNVLWALEAEQAPQASAIIRSHTHYHAGCFGPGWVGMTTPALQGLGTRFGARQMSGIVHFGVIQFLVESKDNFRWEPHMAVLSTQKAKVFKA